MTFFSNNSGSLQTQQSSIVKISRFNDSDFQKYIVQILDEHMNNRENRRSILLSSTIDNKTKGIDEYIRCSDKLSLSGFKILSEILSVKNIIYCDLSFTKGIITSYSDEQGTIQSKSISLEIRPGKIERNINNYICDPYIEVAGKVKDGVTDLLEKFLKDLLPIISGDSTIVFIGGEYFWINNPAILINKLIEKADSEILKVVVDNNAIFQALLNEGGISSSLRFLSKNEFGPNVVYRVPETNKKKNTESLSVYSNSGVKEKYIYKDKLNIFLVEPGEMVKDIQFANDSGIYMVGPHNAKISDIPKFIFPFQKKKILERKDFHTFFVSSKDNFVYYEAKRRGIMAFDYIHTRNLNKMKLSVIDGELVDKGDLLCRFSEYGSLVEKRLLAGDKGYVDLSKVNFGYIFIQDKNPKIRKINLAGAINYRPNLIIGDIAVGILGEDIKYISKLNKENYHKFIQNGCRAVVCNSMESELYFDIQEFNIHNLLTICILDGLDVELGENQEVFSKFSRNYTKIDPVSKYLIIGMQKTTKNFYHDIEGISYENSNMLGYRVGHRVRIIDENDWGDYATIVGVEKDLVKLRHGKSLDNTNLLNLF